MLRSLLAFVALAWAGAASAQVPGCVQGAQCVLLQQFTPVGFTTLAVTNVSSSVPFPATGPTLGLLVTNDGPDTVYVAIGASSIVATTLNMPVGPGRSVYLPQGTWTTLAAVTASGTGQLTMASGTGAPILVHGYVRLPPGTEVLTTALGGIGTDYSANKPSLPADLLATVPATPARNSVEIQNDSADPLAVVLDDGSGGQVSIWILGPIPATGPRAEWRSQTFKGRVQVYGASPTDQVAVRQE